MHTYGNNALSIVDNDIVETLTVYTDKEISLIVESAYDLGRRKEKLNQRRAAKQKRKEHVENIKLTITLFCGMFLFPFAMFLMWLAFGY